jgi:hypothetical protein
LSSTIYFRLITSYLLFFVLIIIISETFENVLAQGQGSDVGGFNSNFESNAQNIAEELGEWNETEIRDYPLTDLPIEEIKAVFMILDSGNITKVLLNIPVNDIQEIQNKLSEDEFNNILNRVSIENQTQIKERIDNN